MQGRIRLRRLFLTVAGLAAASLLLAGSASAADQYTDATGDSGAAPDIKGATVTKADDINGLLFLLSIANASSGDVQTALFIDSDANPATGNAGLVGADYAFVLDSGDRTWGFAHWTGAQWDWDTPNARLVVAIIPDGFLIALNRDAIGNARRINFWVQTTTGEGGSGKFDEAPDDGVWNYDLSAGGPAIEDVMLQAKPAAPKAGKAFTVTVTGLKLPPVAARATPQPESYSCKATLAGRPLAGGGPNGCTFKLSKKARGKKLVVAVTVQYQGVTKTVERTYKVKK
jgi:hypothetical protein